MINEKCLIDATLVNADSCKATKIKTHFAKIIVDGGTVERPYYSILYYDPKDREYHIGYSSYYLSIVANWLSEYFELADDSAFSEPVVHGQWERCFEDWWHQFEGDQCSACKFQIYGGVSHFMYCPNCGAKMDGERRNNG